MDISRLFYTLDGMFAYDSGAIRSGIKDEPLRVEVINYLDSLDENEFRVIISIFIREYYLSDEALNQGYGIEDIYSFIKWLDQYMGIQI